MGAGEKLQAERLNQGLTLEEIEEETKIRKYYLQALEQENYEILPPQVYATGFVKRYARFLGMDEHQLVDEFKDQAYPQETIQHQLPQELPPTNKISIPWRNIMAGIVFLILAIWLGNYVVGYISDRAAENPEPQTPQVPQVQEPKDTEPDIPKTPAEQTEPIAKLTIKAKQACWLTVAVDGVSVFTGVLKAGEEKNYEGKEMVYVKAGNAGGIDLIFNGEQQVPLGAVGEVQEREFQAE